MTLVVDDSFARAVNIVLMHEGGFADVEGDRGGATKYGISLRLLKNLPDGDLDENGLVDSKDIESLTRDQAIDFYFREFWSKFQYHKLHDWQLAAKIFDLSVNMGPARAHRLLQQALLAVGKKVDCDGKLGVQTIKTANAAPRDALVSALRSEAAGYYRQIAKMNPDQEKFLNGWLRRAYS